VVTFSSAQAWQPTVGLPLNSNVRQHKTPIPTMTWIQKNFPWLAMALIAVLAELIPSNYWLGAHPLSLYAALIALVILVFLSFNFFSFLERLVLAAAYCWVSWSIIRTFAAIYERTGFADKTSEFATQNALYFSLCMWTSLGFEAITPTAASRPWVMWEAGIGLVANSILIALVLRLFLPLRQL
jgi:hypothetical protein